jgi:hypothetical protein
MILADIGLSGDQSLPTLIVTVISLAIAALSFIYSTRAVAQGREAEARGLITQKEIAEQEIDAAAYERAKGLYESMIAQLENENRRLNAYVDALKRAYDTELNLTADLRERVGGMAVQLDWFRRNWAAKGFELPPGNGKLFNTGLYW